MAAEISSSVLGLTPLILCLLLLTLTAQGGAIECFVCSYAPRSNTTRLDVCTETNFTENVINTRTCDFGCERVASYDVNGELESYHRNCAYQDTPMTNTCETYDTVILTKIVCACDYSYCNSSPKPMSPSKLHLAAATALLYIWHFTFRRASCNLLNTLPRSHRAFSFTLIPT
ncbi:hypothetical protein FHG87_001444 [Trinorchestia longiramus]|nr:hypothetical protein FHG87_001444 [Trinorchestia longiramus]